ncbi:efflux RND transporter periplasmic adaptor subunit [Pseudomonas matsuisoli]|uniref:Secretion protein HlyD n=1 Tax=Pseudomonas matsuisoli TaxID=1515666 RepID=A0A917Q1Q7_9PSED|nr:efflux RND transporter periplasmic adaptor subunit [Pseudomonas matsuisoli]GGK04817.1 secretion protein HlyD [Pseudomonas matsuisoli]
MSIKPASTALVSALVIAISLAGCGQQSDAPQQEGAAPAPKVGVVTLQAQPFSLTSELPGRTAAFRMAEVRPQVNGIIEKRLFKEGTEVKVGQQLYQIDDSVYQATLGSAKATLASAQSLAQRYKQLVSDRAVSQQQYDEAQAAYLQAKADLDQAQINVRYTKVMAPIAGRIGRSAVTEGALVSNGQTNAMATIQQLDPIYVDVSQSVTDLLSLRRDLDAGRLQRAGDNSAKVKLLLSDGSTYGQEGTLEFSEVSVDEGTGSVILRAVFPNPDRVLLPGMFVRAELQAGVRQEALLVPQQGITRNQRGQPTAMVVNASNEVELRDVKTDRAVGNRWLVSEGLQPGDRVITEGLQYVQPGAKVDASEATNVDQPGAANTEG